MSRRQRKKMMAEINIVPYIDVMLVLLVIFMITAPLLNQGVNVNLPKTDAKAVSSKQEPLIVSINKGGNYFLNTQAKPDKAISERVIVNQVAAQVKAASNKGQNLQVLVKGDSQVDYGKVVGLMAALQKAGVDHVGLITQPNS